MQPGAKLFSPADPDLAVSTHSCPTAGPLLSSLEYFLQFPEACPTLSAMKQPLALLLYEKLLPGGQLVNRLQDLGYRVQPVPAPADLVPTAEREKPLVAFVDLEPRFEKTCEAIAALRRNSATSHLPVIAFTAPQREEAQESARRAGATLVVNDAALLLHLSQFLDQALQVD
jgi:CheY-like chemotaxis protein